ncbi:MAG TPA: hypothetical protein VL463_08365 [Kofleriaceae bacterium]|nr:hypothetical protein [Kofleriaceae bacterium]
MDVTYFFDRTDFSVRHVATAMSTKRSVDGTWRAEGVWTLGQIARIIREGKQTEVDPQLPPWCSHPDAELVLEWCMAILEMARWASSFRGAGRI